MASGWEHQTLSPQGSPSYMSSLAWCYVELPKPQPRCDCESHTILSKQPDLFWLGAEGGVGVIISPFIQLELDDAEMV